MFTGIVREVGRVASVEGGPDGVVLVVEAPAAAERTTVGGSVAVSGCCLSAESVDGRRLSFHVVPETLERTTLGSLHAGDAVNVEPALRVGDPLGGHFVQGHVDGVGTVRSAVPEGNGLRVAIEAPGEVLRFCVEKGSIAIDGVSLTIASLAKDAFEVALVPQTLAETTLASLAPGRRVNLEVDLLAKLVARHLEEACRRGLRSRT
ncbi:MAG: riboflavin synthase [Thermoleophilia bacterium]|nr:riboflavin synthase [Thermoleophilia bacterium]